MKPEDKINLAYFELKQNKLYYNQLKEYTHLSHSSVQSVLKKLTNSKILKLIKTKSNTFYEIQDKKYFALKFSEIATTKFNELNIGVKNPLRNFLKDLSKEIFSIVLFGSASMKEEQKTSDIDLLIISHSKINIVNNKKEAELTSKYPLSIFQVTTNQFIENKDDIIIQARKTGFPICKEQNFYEVLLDEY